MNLSPNHQRMYAASKQPRLSDTPAANFVQCVARCAVVVGQPVPRDEAIVLMHEVLTEQFVWATIADIELAIRLNIAGQLPEKVEPYGEFSSAYVSAILNIYQSERGKAVLRGREIEERIDVSRQLSPPVVSDDQWREMMAEDVRRFIKGSDAWRFGATRMMKWLEDTGQINDATFSNEQWLSLNARARESVMQRRAIGPRAVEALSAPERARFDQECVDRKKEIIYAEMLKSMAGEVVR
jgi:hypothetical protein